MEPRTEAGRRLLDGFGPMPRPDAQELHRRSAMGRRVKLQAAILAIEEEARTVNPEGLDVELLARAIHDGMLHNGRGGVDDDLAKRACVQFGWEQSRCRQNAERIAAEYARLATTSSSPRTPTDGAEG